MKLYSVKINLAGSLLNQVRKDHVTAAEIVLLRAVHGDDAVNEITHTANVNRSDRAERARLSKMYTKTSPKGTKRGAELVREFLGIESQALPDEVPEIALKPRAEDFSLADEEEEVIEAVNAAPIKRKVVEKRAAPAADALTA